MGLIRELSLLRDRTGRPLSILKPTASLAVHMHDFCRSMFCEQSCSHVPGPNSSSPEASVVFETCDSTSFSWRRIHNDLGTEDLIAFNL